MNLRSRLENSFVAGLVLIGPLVITLYILRVLVNWSLQFINPIVAGTRLVEYTGNVEVVAQLVAVVLIVATITVLGFLAQWSVAKHLFANFGQIINIVPLVSTIYGSVRGVASSLAERDSQFESVVLVEHPRLDVYSIGLVTNDGIDRIDQATGEETAAVFLPNSPNPTAGRLVFVPQEQLYETDMSVREGMGLILTTGIGNRDQPVGPHLDDGMGAPVD